MRLHPWLAAVALAAPLIAQAQASAGAWPSRPVRLVVPYAPGGTTDYAARQIAQKLTEQTGASFYVDNKAGASGTIGSSFVAKATPDGGTFLINDTTSAMLPHLFKKLPWEPGDLVPVTTIVDAPLVLVVGASSPYKTVEALIDDLDRIVRVVKVVGFVASAPDFTGQPAVINGASELLQAVLGEVGQHARSAVGVAALPMDAPVEVEMVVSFR